METRTVLDAGTEPGPEEVKAIRAEIRRIFDEMDRMDARIEENLRRFDLAQARTRMNLERIKELMSKNVA